MSYEPERDSAAYLGGVMRPRRRRRFEDHLRECEDCWREVDAGRLGRRVAESARDLAPQRLRETVRAAVSAMAPPRRRLRWPLAGAVLGLAVLSGGLTTLLLRGPQPPPIAQAVADFRQGRLPSETPPAGTAPDLSSLDLTLTASGAGALKGLHVDAYTYRHPSGKRILVYLSEELFPVARGARQSAPDGPWRARVGDVELLCAQHPHALLALSDDAALLTSVAEKLEISRVPV